MNYKIIIHSVIHSPTEPCSHPPSHHPLAHLPIHSFTHSFTHSVSQSGIYLVRRSASQSSIPSVSQSVINWFTHQFITSVIPSVNQPVQGLVTCLNRLLVRSRKRANHSDSPLPCLKKAPHTCSDCAASFNLSDLVIKSSLSFIQLFCSCLIFALISLEA